MQAFCKLLGLLAGVTLKQTRMIKSKMFNEKRREENRTEQSRLNVTGTTGKKTKLEPRPIYKYAICSAIT